MMGHERTCHEHYFYPQRAQTQNRMPHLRQNSHGCCCGAIKPPHDSCSHSKISYPVKRWLGASSPSRSAGPRPPPFPSAHGAPYVLCQHCFVLLLLPSYVLPPGTLLPSRTPSLTLKCGICLNLSTFSTRHLYAAASPSFSTKQITESSSMPGYGLSHGGTQEVVATEAFMFGIPDYKYGRPEFASQFHQCNDGHLAQRENFELLLSLKGGFKHEPTEASEPSTANDINVEFIELKRKSEAAHMSQGKDFDTGDFCDALEKSIVEARDYSYAELIRQEKVNGDAYNGICELTSEEHHSKARQCSTAAFLINDELQRDSHLEKEQEITSMNSVQSWVDSLTPEVGYESDFSLHCSEKRAVGCEKHGRSPQRSPLHQHFGYKTPSELFERVIFSEDEEMRARTDTNSTESSSSSPNNACQRTDIRATCLQVRAPSLRGWAGGAVMPHCNSLNGEESDAHGSLARLIKRGLKKGDHSPASRKGKVVVNGHFLSSTAIKHAEERAGKLRPGSYWYDSKAGFWGVEGGRCLGILPPMIEELSYPLVGNCSNGNTQVYINGRELHSKDLAVLSQRGLPEKAGMAYSLGFDGVLVDETTGLQIKHLGKLAPTVERKGKGFGMFAGPVVEAKTPVVQGKSNIPSK